MDQQTRDDDERLRVFMKALLRDVRALERMLESPDRFESARRRVGAEQEMFLVDDAMSPAPLAVELLERIDDDRLTTELARFNLEANVSPQPFRGSCLSDMASELNQLIGVVRRQAEPLGADVLLVGILPTVRMRHLGLENMTPAPRYRALDEAMRRLRQGRFDVSIRGIHELHTEHDNVMLESCNTSFQIHFQVAPGEFAQLYNAAQLVSAPVLAAGVNSGLLLGKRLWHETRLALFERGVDSRSSTHRRRGLAPRVSFGDGWIRESVIEIYREQIARHRVVLPIPTDQDPLAILDAGGTPELDALRAHNGTIYRWNRACYGITAGVPHLRIENRVLPAGPTVADEVANAAFFFGLMAALLDDDAAISSRLSFDHARDNFFSAARHGLRAQFTWLDGRTHPAADLITEHLLPMARDGLRKHQIDSGDVEHYLGIIERRVDSGRTGTQWMFDSLDAMEARPEVAVDRPQELRERALTTAMLENQRRGTPISQWPLAVLDDDEDWSEAYRTVGQFMTTDLFTVRANDLLDLAASVMDWRHVKHVPVEDEAGKLVGLITYRMLLRLVGRGEIAAGKEVVVGDIMCGEPITVSPQTRTLEAMNVMRRNQVSCLPVVEDGKLVGIITQSDLIEVSAGLLEKYLRE